jgi:hypothetical protein
VVTPRTPRLFLEPLVLLLLVGALYQGRRWFIRSWFVKGSPHPPRAVSAAPPRSGDVHPVRVILIDGLSESVARSLPGLTRLCRDGLTLTVDVGFPTVSLPVQHVLWTGTWQSQSGVMFLVKRMERPVFDSLQRQVTRRSAEALAVAESQSYIVSSFPFSRVIGPTQQKKASLPPEKLEQESLRAAQSDAALVFLHFLAVDEIGHDVGAAHRRYLEAARRADRLLAALWKVRDPKWTVLALSDHGHHLLPPGGHGGPEPSIRLVRACLAGPGVPAGKRARAVLPDLTRILADSLNVGVPRNCQGRSLAGVLEGAPAREAPTPFRPGALGFLVPLLLLGLVFEIGRRTLRGPSMWVLSLPWGMALGLLLVVAQHGSPSLSRFYVYRALPVELWGAALLTAATLLLQAWTLRRVRPGQARGLMAALCLLPALATAALTGWPVNRPPLIPYLTAWASTLGYLAMACLAGLFVASFVGAIFALVRTRRTGGPPPGTEAD